MPFPGLDGVVPGFGRQDPNDWGLGFELRSTKAPHWTAPGNDPGTFGHFGRSGCFLWVDPAARLALAVTTDQDVRGLGDRRLAPPRPGGAGRRLIRPATDATVTERARQLMTIWPVTAIGDRAQLRSSSQRLTDSARTIRAPSAREPMSRQ